MYLKKLGNLDEMNKLLETQHLPKCKVWYMLYMIIE